MIAVIGSSNMDLVVNAKRAPEAGETLLGTSFFMSPGGKGANQAVAIARLGGVPLFVSKLGSDVFGRQLREHFLKENMDVSYVFETKDEFESQIKAIKELEYVDYQVLIEKELAYSMGIGIDNYQSILD